MILRNISLNVRYRRRMSTHNVLPVRPPSQPHNLKMISDWKINICIISNKISCTSRYVADKLI